MWVLATYLQNGPSAYGERTGESDWSRLVELVWRRTTLPANRVSPLVGCTGLFGFGGGRGCRRRFVSLFLLLDRRCRCVANNGAVARLVPVGVSRCGVVVIEKPPYWNSCLAFVRSLCCSACFDLVLNCAVCVVCLCAFYSFSQA